MESFGILSERWDLVGLDMDGVGNDDAEFLWECWSHGVCLTKCAMDVVGIEVESTGGHAANHGVCDWCSKND